MIPISVKYLCRSSKHRSDLSHYLKRFMERADYYCHLKYRGGRTIPLFQLGVWCKACRSPTLCRYFKAIIDFKWQKQGSLRSFRPLTGWGLHRFVSKFQRELERKKKERKIIYFLNTAHNSEKKCTSWHFILYIGRPIEWYFCQPACFLVGQYL